jgi:hypothetical protein
MDSLLIFLVPVTNGDLKRRHNFTHIRGSDRKKYAFQEFDRVVWIFLDQGSAKHLTRLHDLIDLEGVKMIWRQRFAMKDF